MTATDVEDRLKNTLPEYAMPQVRIYYVENVDDAHDINCGVFKLLIFIHYDLLYLPIFDLGDFNRIHAVSRERKN